jgi:hypothetical protein
VTKAVRNDDAENRPQMDEILNMSAEDILMVHVADGQNVENHCPDFAVLRMNEHRQIVLVKLPFSLLLSFNVLYSH